MLSDDSEDEAPEAKRSSRKSTAQKRKKDMVRIYSPERPDVVQPARTRKQQQGDDFVKGLGQTLSATAAASDKAALERHRETQRNLAYATELKVYLAEKKQALEYNKMVMQQRQQEREYADKHNVPCGHMLDYALEPVRPVAPVMNDAQATGPSSGPYGDVSAPTGSRSANNGAGPMYIPPSTLIDTNLAM